MKKYFTKLCARCQKVTIPKGRQLYCGSYKRKTGCSYIVRLESSRDYSRNLRKTNPDYWKRTEEWRIKNKYYGSNGRKGKQQLLARIRYHKAQLKRLQLILEVTAKTGIPYKNLYNPK